MKLFEKVKEKLFSSPPVIENLRETVPLHVVFLVDCSGSLKKHISVIQKAINKFMGGLAQGSKVGLVSFGGSGVQVNQRLTTDFKLLGKALLSLKAGGRSPLGPAILMADELLVGESAKKAIVLFSDGDPTNPGDAAEYAEKAKQHDIQIITVGVGTEVSGDFLQKISSSSSDCHLVSGYKELLTEVFNIATDLTLSSKRRDQVSILAKDPLLKGEVEFPVLVREDDGGYSILVSPGGRLGEREREWLARKGIEKLFIPGKARGQYERSFKDNIDQFLSDKSVGLEEKVEVVNENASFIVREVLEGPKFEGNLERAKDVVEQVLKLVLTVFSEEGCWPFHRFSALLSKKFHFCKHAINVCELGLSLSRYMGEEDFCQLEELGVGLLLHDIGKSYISPEILHKSQDQRSLKERCTMMRHPYWGIDIIRESRIYVPPAALLVIEQHHERADGSGYPRRLKLKDIHPFSRLAAIVDIYDVLTTRGEEGITLRPQRALQVMGQEMKGKVDPDIFESFVKLLASGTEAIPQPIGEALEASDHKTGSYKALPFG